MIYNNPYPLFNWVLKIEFKNVPNQALELGVPFLNAPEIVSSQIYKRFYRNIWAIDNVYTLYLEQIHLTPPHRQFENLNLKYYIVKLVINLWDKLFLNNMLIFIQLTSFSNLGWKNLSVNNYKQFHTKYIPLKLLLVS